MRIKKGDFVQVISGEDKGKRGRVLRLLPQKSSVIIEGINYIYKHVRKSQKNTQGGRVQKEAPVHISNVMLYCPHTQAPTRTHYVYEQVSEENKKKTSEGEQAQVKAKLIKIRYGKKSGRQV